MTQAPSRPSAQPTAHPATPPHRLSDSDYARAEQMLAPYRARRVPGATLVPTWLDDGARFAYQVGSRFVVVHPGEGTRRDAFDHDRLAAALSVASDHAVDAADLPLTDVELPGRRVSDGADVGGADDAVRFTAFEQRWGWSDAAGTCVRADGVQTEADHPAGPEEIASPDGAWVAFRRDGNIWVRPRTGEQGPEQELALTDDATPDHEYGTVIDPLSARTLMRSFGLGTSLNLAWSPDSTRILVHRLDQRGLAEQVLVESSPPDGGRPVAHRYRFPIPGDEAQATMSWVVLTVPTSDDAEGSIVRQQGEPYPVVHPDSMQGYRWWTGGKGESAHFLQQSRDGHTLELRRLDPATGAVTTLVRETGRTRVDPTPEYGDPPMAHVLDSGEVLWWSQRDGWGHLYLYPAGHTPDESAGHGQPAQVTSGRWLVRRVLRVDQERRQVWFLAAGLVEHDPYVRQVCRIGLDGTGFTRLTDDDLDHDAVSPPDSSTEGSAYIVDRASSLSRPPRSVVLDGDGRVLVELESPGTDALAAVGWTPPERFRTLAADGRTTVHGLLWRPHGFDPSRRYPVIDHVYPGPQVARTTSSFDNSASGDTEALAALGFVVVAIDGRGTPGRGKAFHDESHGALGDAGSLADHVAAIRELSHRYPWIDVERVGVTGHSGGGFATARALLAHPGLYKVGVAVAGNHDNGVYLPMWAEQYHGDLSAEGRRAISNPALAANLEGRLLLVHGELDDNVHPYQTLRLVDALIEADKDVDMLLVPGAEHALYWRRHYVARRTWDYFVRHLHGVEPPAYRLAPLPAAPASALM